jgi:uncharacterized protein (TIGR02452 family)
MDSVIVTPIDEKERKEMNRDSLSAMAKDTVRICELGQYQTTTGKSVAIAEEIRRAVKGTVLHAASNLPQLQPASPALQTRIEVANETTFRGLVKLAGRGGHISCLNFASAKNPGGGFLGGAQAQEEALARASALYPCLLAAPEYYERNRGNRSAVYLDLVIFSPQVPFFRKDAGDLLEKPILASVITAPAPNRGAVAQNEPGNLPLVEAALRRRAEMVLHVAQTHGVERLVLGAWGCGVFRNDPAKVASIFAALIKPPGRFAGVFRDVLFSVYDRSEPPLTLRAFSNALQ